jgi:AIPR protein
MNNKILLEDCLKEFKDSNQITLSNDDVFELFSLSQISRRYNLSYDDIENSIVDGSKDGGIDFFLILADDTIVEDSDQLDDLQLSNSNVVRIFIGQSKNTDSFKESIIDKIYISIALIFDLEIQDEELNISFNDNLTEKIMLFRKIWRKSITKGAKIQIEYFYSCKSNEKHESDTFLTKCNLIKSFTSEKVQNCEVCYNSYSAKELLELYRKRPETELELKFKEIPVSVNYSNNSIGYIGVVKVPDYFNFIVSEDHAIRETIFEENIRHFQGDVDVNKTIKDSLQNDLERDFWWLNNGITIICSNVGQIGKSLVLSNVQIVNGLQTSFTVAKFYSLKDNDDRSLLIKIIVSTDKKTIDKIIAATNRQTPVNPVLLRATDDIQRKLEMFFEQKGYFYDRRKNYYKNQGKPSSKIFGIQSTAQIIHSMMNYKPSEARAKPTTLIKTQESYSKIFREDIEFNVYLEYCLISKKVLEYIKAIDNKDSRSIAKAFSHHIFRVIVSMAVKKSHPIPKDIIQDINTDKINEKLIGEAVNWVMHEIESFKQSSKTQNLISISKSGLFDEHLSSELKKKY